MVDRRSELEASLERDPYDDAAHAVYADYLIEQGDPRGELAALTTASDWNRDALPGLVAFLDAHPELVPPGRARLTWRGGFIQRAEVGIDGASELLLHPACRFLAELSVANRVTLTPTDDPRLAEGLAPVVGLLAVQHRRSLRSFEVTTGATGAYQGWLGDVTAISDAAPELERLRLAGGLVLDRIHLPRLQELALSELRMQPAVADVLRRGSWAELSRLELRAGHCTYETLDRIAAWLTSPLPSLTALALTGTPHIHRVLVPMMTAGTLRDLRTLDLRDDQLTDDHVTIFESLRPAWQLEHLDLSSNRLSKRGIERVRRLAKRVVVTPQIG